MNMKGRLYGILAMAAMFGGASFGGGNHSPRSRREPPRKLTPEELEAVLVKSKEKLIQDIRAHNLKTIENKHWIMFEVHDGIEVAAYNKKNAIKTFNGLLRQNNLQITEGNA